MIQFSSPYLVAPDASIIGVIEETRSHLDGTATRVGPCGALPASPGNYILDHALSQASALEKLRAVSQLLRLRRDGATIVLISHDEPLLEGCADEIWWIRSRELVARGDPFEVLKDYRGHVAHLLRSTEHPRNQLLMPTMRRGDGRAAIESIELLGGKNEPISVWRSGEDAAIRVTVAYAGRADDPVVGIMIRNRIGLNVYGTNTELEDLKLGPVSPGHRLRITYQFRCDLCPGDYTVTAASHDPDGIWHDWMEDAVAFSVADSRYTAGVANLRAKVAFERYSQSAST